MSKKDKRLRIWTHRVKDGIYTGSWEAIEMDDLGVCFWVGGETCLGAENDVNFSFPVGIDWIEECFVKHGRMFDVTKLPANIVKDPYFIYK